VASAAEPDDLYQDPLTTYQPRVRK